jgi:pimeloyl-ACP methyl ester carboxylesterase
MDIVLIAGLWLPNSAWAEVCVGLKRLGHRPMAVALPGVDDTLAGVDGAAATLADQLNAVLTVVDACERPLVVGHSAACSLAWMVADRRPLSIEGVVLIGGFPKSDGSAYADFFETVDGVMAFPGWDSFDGPDSADLTQSNRVRIAGEAVPVPATVSKGIVGLKDEGRFNVRVVLVCPEYTPEQAKEWIDAGDVPELANAQHVSYVDIDSGHWPMVSRPAELTEILDRAAKRS